jgi:hypothetical protein
MAHEDYRLAGTALALGRFTLQDLARTARVKRNTAGSWFRRHAECFEAEDAGPSTGRKGRPRKQWRLLERGAAELRVRLEGLYREVAPGASASDRVLHGIERQLGAWEDSQRRGDSAAAQQLIALRSLLRIAWEDTADRYAALRQVDSFRLKRLAELESQAGVGALPDSNWLPDVAAWLAERLDQMTRRGVAEEFAGRVLRARAEARKVADQVKLTAAALAAPVWSDERIIDVPETQLRRCAVVADVVPTAKRVAELAKAIDQRPAFGYCHSPDEAQAVVIGLTARPDARSPEIFGWLAQLHLSHLWQPQLAPAVLQGLAEAPGIRLDALLRYLSDSLERVLKAPEAASHHGSLRRNAYDYSSRVLTRPKMLPLDRPSTTGGNEADTILENMSQFFTRREDDGFASGGAAIGSSQ